MYVTSPHPPVLEDIIQVIDDLRGIAAITGIVLIYLLPIARGCPQVYSVYVGVADIQKKQYPSPLEMSTNRTVRFPSASYSYRYVPS